MSEQKANYGTGVDAALYNEMIDGGMSPADATKTMDSLVFHGHDCPECRGYGEDAYGEPCELCDGKGEVPERVARYIAELNRNHRDALGKVIVERDSMTKAFNTLYDNYATLSEGLKSLESERDDAKRDLQWFRANVEMMTARRQG